MAAAKILQPKGSPVSPPRSATWKASVVSGRVRAELVQGTLGWGAGERHPRPPYATEVGPPGLSGLARGSRATLGHVR